MSAYKATDIVDRVSITQGGILELLEPSAFWLSIIFILAGAGAVFAIYKFGKKLSEEELIYLFRECFFNSKRYPKAPEERKKAIQELSDCYKNFLRERNDFWEKYGQIILSIVIIIVLAVLLLTKTISPEAGLPILSAVGGFSIAKSVSTSSSNTNRPIDPEKPNNPKKDLN